MLILEMRNIKKYYAERLIVDIPDLKIYDTDKIGLVGVNGAGKSTLLKILNGDIEPDEGVITWHGTRAYIPQLEEDDIPEYMSGGEKTRIKVDNALADIFSNLLMADEPTSNLDFNKIENLQQRLLDYTGGIVLISHDRKLLNSVCNKIIELDNGEIKLYPGNYNDFIKQKELERARRNDEYEQYNAERRRLAASLQKSKEHLAGMSHTPKRMGNSEARLHKNGTIGQKKYERFVKNMERKLDSLEAKEKPRELERPKIDIQEGARSYSKFIITGSRLNKSVGGKVILSGAELSLKNSSKTALIGDNGVGKTTLLRMIMDKEKGISVSPSAQIAYFAQDLKILDESKTILENVMSTTAFNQSKVRLLLARLLFKRDEVFKKVSELSGGERVKVSLAKIFSSDVNTIILDEPTNYLDIYSSEALEELILGYGGTMLLVTHDRQLIDRVCTDIWELKNGIITTFDGNYSSYVATLKSKKQPIDLRVQLMQLENKLAIVSGKLSKPKDDSEAEALDIEFKALASAIRDIKKELKIK